MVSYDATQMAFFVALVLAFAVTGVTLALGLAMDALSRSHRAHAPQRATRSRRYHARLAFHH